MSNTHKEIVAQVKRLKAIGDGEGLKGEYVDELKDSAEKLAGKLEKAAGRYEHVATQLGKWKGRLEHAQTETAGALKSAKEAEADIKELVGTLDEDSDEAKKAAKELDAGEKGRLESAQEKYKKAEERYNTAVGDYEDDAKKIADKIRDIIDDAVEDGFWSAISNWVERNVDWIKKALEVLGYIATILAMVALVIAVVAAFVAVPGGLLAILPLLTQIGTAITFFTLGTHVLMAATGNGGWGDVGFDIIGLFTFKMGTAAAKGIKAGTDATRRASVQAARRETKDALRGSAKRAELKQAVKDAPNKKARNAALKRQRRFERSLKSPGAARELPKPTAKEVFRAGGDPDVAAQIKYAAREGAKRSGDNATREAAHQTARAGRRNSAAFVAGTGLDLGDKAVGSSDLWPDKPKIGPYSDAKDWNNFSFSNSGWHDRAP
ncbi:hypothetical protein ABZU86_10305 [Streptomyces sp. NPDC005271]|uniref:hypothetical protein n=1 Tax=unclassified Streptomyces TaxID=2593676 RepID=UPI0033B0A41F